MGTEPGDLIREWFRFGVLKTVKFIKICSECLKVLLVPSPVLLAGAADAKKDVEQLQGTWIVIAAIVDGKKIEVPADKIGQAKMVFKGDTIAHHGLGNGRVKTHKFKINPAKNPKELDVILKGEEPGEKDQVKVWIYELEGDNLKLCSGKDGDAPRPTAFVSKPGSGALVLTLKREKKK